MFVTLSLALLGVKLKADKRGRHLHHAHYLLKVGVVLNMQGRVCHNSDCKINECSVQLSVVSTG
jgi:hypothetical protein